MNLNSPKADYRSGVTYSSPKKGSVEGVGQK
jgi:hypothetical protein